MKKIVQVLILFIFILTVATATSCIGLKNQVGHTKFEMLNKIGQPSRILNLAYGEKIFVYFIDKMQNALRKIGSLGNLEKFTVLS